VTSHYFYGMALYRCRWYYTGIFFRPLSQGRLSRWRLVIQRQEVGLPCPEDYEKSVVVTPYVRVISENELSVYGTKKNLGCILLRKGRYVYLVERSLQNIKMTFKLGGWLWFIKNVDYMADLLKQRTVLFLRVYFFFVIRV
jgi:hypothetical protein